MDVRIDYPNLALSNVGPPAVYFPLSTELPIGIHQNKRFFFCASRIGSLHEFYAVIRKPGRPVHP
jgi:hypothetical protein